MSLTSRGITDYFNINFTQSYEYKLGALMILQLPSLERKRPHGISDTKGVFQLTDLPQCGEESDVPALLFQNKKELSKRIEGKDTNNGHKRSYSLTSLSVRMFPAHGSGLWWLFMQTHLFFLCERCISPIWSHLGIIKQFSQS